MNTPTDKKDARLIGAGMVFPFILVTSLFALWGFANDITNPLVAAFKDVFVINNAQSSWVQMAFYGGYGTMAIPAALFIRKFSYKSGIVLGLILYATGALICVPAASMASFNLFLAALYILTFGLAFLETTANPYVLSMGPEETATRRLNLAQAFNPMGSLTGMTVASIFILSNLQVEDFRTDFAGYHSDQGTQQVETVEYNVLPIFQSTPKERVKDPVMAEYVANNPEKSLDAALADYKDGELETFMGKTHRELQDHDLKIVSTPYMIIGFVVIGVLVVFLVSKLPHTASVGDHREDSSLGEILGRLFKNPLYLGGVVAQTFYVGAQIMCWTFIIQYAQNELGMDKATAQNHNIGAMVVFLSSRFICTFFLKYISPGALLLTLSSAAIGATLGAIYLEGMAGLYSLMAISACMSLMFPTIYGIALEGLGPDAKIASAGLILAIVGGAFMPRLQGGIMDMETFMGVDATRGSFYLPCLCFIVIAAYACLTRLVHARRRAA
ncbi:MFS transporter [Coraliomargarita sinensis]|uniref:MFS transporter n=1 Tax=Coraliomargarita sinensis TaxID=2174842 RepID=A0A317ZLB8_9BACT|nr:MFS transporter [Coraliomargarita sinensis]PXA04738.1 MFS transporter [Coraliomargarita sinensis]